MMIDKKVLEKALAEILGELLANPLRYFSESDIHSIVYSELSKKIQETTKLYDTSLTIGKNQYGAASTQKYQTCCMHREYGVNGIDFARSDLVIFNDADIGDIVDPINLKKGNSKDDYLIPDYILEFGTEKSTGSINNFDFHLENDKKKTDKAAVAGYIIDIQRIFNKTNSLYKYDRYVERLRKINYDVNGVRQNSKTKILSFLVSIGSDSIVIFRRGKVKIYCSNEKKFKSINKHSYCDYILQELSSQ